MLICQEEGCECFHHRLLSCMEQGLNDEAIELLQKMENPSDAVDDWEMTLLHYAVEYDNATMVLHLIEKECNVDAEDDHVRSPLKLAVRDGNVEIVEILLANNADIFTAQSALEIFFYRDISCDYYTPATEEKIIKRRLVSEMFCNKLSEDFLTDRSKMTKILADASNSRKLIFAVCGNLEMTKFMLENGTHIDDLYEANTGSTALHCAIALRKFETVKSLIQLGANVSEINKNNYTPLGFYVMHKFEEVDKESEVLKTLLKLSTNLHIPHGRRANFHDVNNRRLNDVECLLYHGNRETVRTVLQSNIDAILTNLYDPLLCILIANKNIDMIDIIDFGIEINANERNSDDKSVLQSAAGNLSKVEYLVKNGADVNRDMVLADAALYWYSEEYSAKVTELLLQYGAEPQITFANGETLIGRLLRCRINELSTKIMLSHFAIIETTDKSIITEFSRSSIEADSEFKSYFDSCLQQLGEMKSTVVYGTVTLFKLLIESEEKLRVYVHNQELIMAFELTMVNMQHLESYYVNTLRRRVAKVVERVEFEKKVAPIIEVLTGICADTYFFIVDKIMSHLNLQDLENLYSLKSISLAIK